MICGVVKGSTIEEILEQIPTVQNHAAMLELRLDYLNDWKLTEIEKLKKAVYKPAILTLRTVGQGGAFKGSHEEYLTKLKELITLKPHFLDVEFTVTADEAQTLKHMHPKTKILLSFHDFKEMGNLEARYRELQKIPADLYKIAVMLHSSSEALYLLDFMKTHGPQLIAMGMGKFGEVTRILSPIFGGAFVYSSMDVQTHTAPGQVPIPELIQVYNYPYLKMTSSIYGLIGDPVENSIGHLSHNSLLHVLDMASVYVKFTVTADELPGFLKLAKKVGIKGLSVTMPLKEEVVKYVDEMGHRAQNIGAVNTLVFEEGKIKGYNTDGKGALDAIESKLKVKDKKMIIIGAGGAAKAVAAEAIERGAHVVILNRNEERAEAMAQILGCRGGGLDLLEEECKEGYDIMVNATPNAMPINPKWLEAGKIAMDLHTQPRYTDFMQHADRKGCVLVFGYEMFVGQALGQFERWFGREFYKRAALKVLGDTVANFLRLT